MATGYHVTDFLIWKGWVTPRLARDKAVHRWYLFPHSFTGDLVHALVDEWQLDGGDRILDPFTGAGTTLLAAKERGIPAVGYDLSPLAVMVSKTKTTPFSRARLESLAGRLEGEFGRAPPAVMRRAYPELVQNALPGGRLEAFDALAARLDELDCSSAESDFFRLAMIFLLPSFSYALASGGWLRWSNGGVDAGALVRSFKERVAEMLGDVREEVHCGRDWWKADIADARALPDGEGEYSAVISSPPYPNRHDYTRVFGVELMFQFLDWKENRALRYQSFHSHPEARPQRPLAKEYMPPKGLDGSIGHLTDPRVKRMLQGYFLDMYLCLREMKRVSRRGAKIALVVGNAQYGGKAVLVDEFTAELGERAGLICDEIRVVRLRGNSAQQMGRYGRKASRESIVLFKKR